MAVNRLTKELNQLQKSPPDCCNAQPQGEDMYLWQGTINGPPGTAYHEGVFFLEIQFPKDYPFKPPKVKFQTKIYHCNVDDKVSIPHILLVYRKNHIITQVNSQRALMPL